ncbi:MAG TPA: hypothetical protein VKT78_12250 [Fimbriimonadaceae bacterium]|nr:hypothetical protein [Fimbriimonadaceae bacterium]
MPINKADEFQQDIQELDAMIAENRQRAATTNQLSDTLRVLWLFCVPALMFPLVFWRTLTGQRRRSRNREGF